MATCLTYGEWTTFQWGRSERTEHIQGGKLSGKKESSFVAQTDHTGCIGVTVKLQPCCSEAPGREWKKKLFRGGEHVVAIASCVRAEVKQHVEIRKDSNGRRT